MPFGETIGVLSILRVVLQLMPGHHNSRLHGHASCCACSAISAALVILFLIISSSHCRSCVDTWLHGASPLPALSHTSFATVIPMHDIMGPPWCCAFSVSWLDVDMLPPCTMPCEHVDTSSSSSDCDDGHASRSCCSST